MLNVADLSRNQISFRATGFLPQLPPGMSVKRCTLLLLVVEAFVELEEVSFDLTFSTKAVGAPCTGQCLDAQEWSDNGKLVVIGTEDGEALSYRFPQIGLEDKAVVELSDRSMTLRLADLGKRNRPSFHFIIAENDDPEPVESSAWFAVDQAHEFLLGQ
ncbi:hypothetical protein [Epibacterium ulvae]|uniref:hypothetical protein n=1 Tax=Epibacterium ulvae TaxID=1156985 RepID=UPI001BFCD55B|nr:hypothetical protein [Epibacterium ulvae]